MDLEQMTHFQVCVIARKQEQALIDRDLALMEQTELAVRCRKQAEKLEVENLEWRAELRRRPKQRSVYDWLHLVETKIGTPTAASAARVLKEFYEGAEPDDVPAILVQAGMPAVTVDCDAFWDRVIAYGRGVGHEGKFLVEWCDARIEQAVAQTAAKYEADILALYDRQREDGNTIAALRAAAPQQHAQAAPMIPTDDMCRAAREEIGIGSNVADHVWRVMAKAAGQGVQQHAQAALSGDDHG